MRKRVMAIPVTVFWEGVPGILSSRGEIFRVIHQYAQLIFARQGMTTHFQHLLPFFLSLIPKTCTQDLSHAAS